jgi:hypothetical protein
MPFTNRGGFGFKLGRAAAASSLEAQVKYCRLTQRHLLRQLFFLRLATSVSAIFFIFAM